MLSQASTLTNKIATRGAVLYHEVAFDVIRCIALFSVVAVHVASPVGTNTNLYEFNWWVGNAYQAVFRSGIPLFLMLSGALLLPRATGVSFVGKRVWRIFIPFSFWTGVYLIARNDLAKIGVTDFLYNLINSSVNHFWYVYTILLFYLLMPGIRYFLERVALTVTDLILALSVTTFASMFIPSDQLMILEVVKHIIFAQYIVLGYCLVTTTQDAWWLKSITLSVVLILIGMAITFLGTYYISNYAGGNSDLLYKSTSLNVFMKALGVWLLIRQTASKISAKARSLISLVSKYSFGVYLMHVLVLEHVLISWLGMSYHNITPVVGIFLWATLTFVFSVAILFVLDKILPVKAAY